MNSLYGNEDPFENGWASEGNPPSAPGYGTQSAFLTSSQLLDHSSSAPAETPAEAIPAQYKSVFANLRRLLVSESDLQTHLLGPLVAEGLLTSYQCTRIIQVVQDHNLQPLTAENNFVQVLGLVALELENAGTGDYVTLQYRKNTALPELPAAAVAALAAESANPESASTPISEGFPDPLSASVGNSDGQTWPEETDALLADQSALSIDTVGPEAPPDSAYISKYLGEMRDRFKPLVGAGDAVKIKEVPEKEGLLFKHINYAITHELHLGLHGPSGPKKVVRRYSDFVWLLEFLLQKYPFRVIPGLPPKKFTVGASPDSQFLQRRRRGLHRFLNQLVKHPVLRSEPMVVTFLSVPTDLVSWRKQARVDYSLEFKGQKISASFINGIWPAVGTQFLQDWATAEKAVPKLIETWTKMVMLVERHEKRQQQIAFDNSKFVETLTKFTDLDTGIYPHQDENNAIAALNRHDTLTLNDSLAGIASFFNKTSTLLVDESFAINTRVLEKFKNFLDYLYSLQELFDRAKRLSVNTIPQLQQRIQEYQQKYDKLNTDGVDVKGSELHKIRQAIINDKQEMFQQLNKDWLIKSCCLEEFVMFQETQFLVSEAWAEWCRGRYKFHEKISGLYDGVNSEIVPDMPMSR